MITNYQGWTLTESADGMRCSALSPDCSQYLVFYGSTAWYDALLWVAAELTGNHPSLLVTL